MTKTVLYYGVILGLYYLMNGVHSYEDEIKYVDVEHKSSGDENSKAANSQDKIFIKSGYPLRGRKIHHTAWSKEDVAEGTQDFNQKDSKLSDSWNIEKLINYLVSLVYKTRETNQSEQATMIQSDPVVRILKSELKSEIKSGDKQDIVQRKTEISNILDRKKKPHTFDFNADYEEKYVDNSESNESYEDESDEECGDSSSEESVHKHKSEADKRHQDRFENKRKNEDCYESVESDMESSNKITANIAISNIAKKDSMISLKNEIAKRRMQSTLQTTNKDKKLPIPDIKVLHETIKAEEKPSVTNSKQINTALPRIHLKIKSTVMPHKTKNTGKTSKDQHTSITSVGIHTPLTRESDDLVILSKTHPTKDRYGGAQLITSSNTKKNQGNVIYSTLPESNTHTPTDKTVSSLSKKFKLPKKEKQQLSTSEAQDISVHSLKGTTETLFLDDKLKTPPPIKATNEINQMYIEKPLNEHTDVTINETPIPMDKINNKVTEFSKSEFPGIENTNLFNYKDSLKDKVKTTEESQDTNKISRSGSIFQENLQNENLRKYQEENKDKKYENEEFNLGNEFIQLSNINTQHNSENKSVGIDVDYHDLDKSQHSSVTSQNVKMNPEDVEETFDTILEFLYKHSNNSLILSLKNSSIF